MERLYKLVNTASEADEKILEAARAGTRQTPGRR